MSLFAKLAVKFFVHFSSILRANMKILFNFFFKFTKITNKYNQKEFAFLTKLK